MKAMDPEIRVNPQRNRSSSRDSDNGFFCHADTKPSTHVLVDGALVTALVPVDSAITITPHGILRDYAVIRVAAI